MGLVETQQNPLEPKWIYIPLIKVDLHDKTTKRQNDKTTKQQNKYNI